MAQVRALWVEHRGQTLNPICHSQQVSGRRIFCNPWFASQVDGDHIPSHSL